MAGGSGMSGHLLAHSESRASFEDCNLIDPPYTAIQSLFEQWAQRIPERVALVSGSQSLTYRQLEERSNRLARFLRERHKQVCGTPLLPGTRIALYLDRSLEMVIAVLAILKAGGAYVPIDPEYPEDRVAFLLQDTTAPLVLTLPNHHAALERVLARSDMGSVAVNLRWSPWERASAEPLEFRAEARDLAYVIYTSGTTGRPKGVMIEHGSLINRIDWMQASYPLSSDDRILQKTPYSFDVSVWELFWAHRHGATLVMAPPQAHKHPETLCQLIKDHSISTLHFVPSMFVSFLDHIEASRRGIPSSLRYVFTSGEALSKQSVATFHRLRGEALACLHNLYGPTETTIDSTYFDCSVPHALVPIGRPIAKTRVHILDPQLHPVPQGDLGELHIGGAGVARGYLNRPELSAERFVPNPFATSADLKQGYTRLYKTGDLVRQLEDDNIEYVGRNDFQVKLRGFRIELGEIENTLGDHPRIRQVVVVVHENQGHQQLVAYYRADEPLETSAIRAYLHEKLPEHMVPAILMPVETFQLTLNGKLDRNALPEPIVASEPYVAPSTELEERICSLVESILGLERVGVDDNFFYLGGDSIAVLRLEHRLRQMGWGVKAQTIHQHPTPGTLALQLVETPLPQNVLDLSDLRLNPMQRLIVGHQLATNPLLYNEHVVLDFQQDPVDPLALNRSLVRLVQHHPLLRAKLDSGYERFLLMAPPDENEDLLEILDVDSDRAYRDHLQQRIDTPIPLRTGPLYRFCLFRIQPETNKLLFMVHHVVSDAESLYALFVPQLHALLEDPQASLPAAPKEIVTPPWRGDLQELAKSLAPIELYEARQSDETQGSWLPCRIPEESSKRLQAMARSQGISLYALLLGSVFALLHKLSHQTRLTVGGVRSLRSCIDEPVFGNFLANEITTISLQPSWTLAELMVAVFRTVQTNLDSILPYDRLLEIVRQSDGSESKLPNVHMTLEPKRMDRAPWTLTQNDTLPSHVKYDLYFEFDLQEELELRIEYRTQAYRREQIEQIQRGLLHILDQFAAAPELRLWDLSLLTDAEFGTLVYDYNQGDKPFPQTTIHGQFAEQAKATPDRLALVSETRSFTYRELDEYSNRLARYLGERYGRVYGKRLPPESRIALYLDRSPELFIAILGILKTGGAYVPIDPEYPLERVGSMVLGLGPALVITQAEHRSRLEEAIGHQEVEVPLVDLSAPSWRAKSTAPLEPVGAPGHLAYVLYTSGTTGRPKGILVHHEAVISLVKETNYLEITPEDAFVQLSSPVFDALTFEIWGPLLNGAKLIVVDQAKELFADTSQFKALLKGQGVSILWLTKTLFDALFLEDPSLFSSLRYVLTGGEALDANLIRRCREHPGRPERLLNGYGPTETTTFATTFDCDQPFCGSVPIGRPINGRKVYVLDPQLNPVPWGVVGELYIGGPGVARGYLNRPAMTAKHFVPNPFPTPEDREQGITRLYKSGDLVRLLEDGNLQFLGRNDFQVKIRGFRIEPGEIETVLSNHPSIRHAVVVVHEHQGHKQLVAYYLAAEPLENSALRAYLHERLPEYMVPTILMPVESFPQTLNGKLDRDALPKPTAVSQSYAAPTTELEERLCSLVQSILDLKQVGIDDDFFRIGGDSILSIQLSSRLKKAGFQVAVQDIFRHKTIRRLAAFAVSQDQDIVQAEQGRLEGSFSLLPVQRWFFDQLDGGWLPQVSHWNQSFLITVPPLDPQRVQAALATLCDHHDMLRAGYRETETGYEQSYRPKITVPTLRRLHASGRSCEELEAILTEWQAGFDLFNEDHEALWTAGYLEDVGAEGTDYLFFAAHHLLLDAVSWRILVEDLRTLFEGGSLPAKTTSYRAWAEALRGYALAQKDPQRHWQAQLEEAGKYPAHEAQCQVHSLRLSLHQTQALLQRTHRAYHTTINDLLLSALSRALHGLTGHQAHPITLEGHGREAIATDLDTTRTVGWFTSLFPLRLEHAEDWGTLIRKTKELLASIPDKGVGYGAWGYFADGPKALPSVRFNYLGVLSGGTSQPWQLANQPSGTPVDPANQDQDLITLDGWVLDGELHFQVRTRLAPDASTRFCADFQMALEQLICHCVEQVDQGRFHHSPSDFNLQISLDLFDRLFTDDIEALLPATSLQQGFVYHAVTQDHDDAYRVQVLIDYPHLLEVEHFRKAWEQGVATYPPLRTSFNWEQEPLQRIHRQGRLAFYLHDRTTSDNIERELQTLQQRDREQPFDLAEPTLLRVHLVARPEGDYTLLLSLHHSIADGWSLPILLEQVHAFYQALHFDQTLSIPADTAYVEAQRYYADHAQACHAYWRERMTHLRDANDLNPMLSCPTDLEKARTVKDPRALTIKLPMEPLRHAVASRGLTPNTLVQFAWHKLIAIYTGDSQTIVGTTVSGRALPVDGITQSIGLYINTLPLIIDWPDGATVLEQLQQLALRIAEMNTHAFEPLASLQPEGRRIFHSLLVYENYPSVAPDPDALLQPVLRETLEKVDYPLSLIVYEEPGELHVRLSYDGHRLDEADAQSLGNRLRILLEQIPEQLDQSHEAMVLLSPGSWENLGHPPALLVGAASSNDSQVKLHDRRALPEPTAASELYVAPATEVEKQLSSLVEHLLGLERVGVRDDLRQSGLNSILSIRLLHAIREQLGSALTFSDLLEHQDISALSSYIDTLKTEAADVIEVGEF